MVVEAGEDLLIPSNHVDALQNDAKCVVHSHENLSIAVCSSQAHILLLQHGDEHAKSVKLGEVL